MISQKTRSSNLRPRHDLDASKALESIIDQALSDASINVTSDAIGEAIGDAISDATNVSKKLAMRCDIRQSVLT